MIHRRTEGFTLVELLVVIAIIGILIGLLLPAVQSARESARRLQCSNHLKQLALAALTHESSQGHFPAGGWGYAWVGDPDRGFGAEQPGGWAYNCLPFLEQQSIHDIGRGETFANKKTLNRQMIATAVSTFNCPTRRSGTFAQDTDSWSLSACNVENLTTVDKVARSDYAGNGGIHDSVPHGGGPSTLEAGAALEVNDDYDGIFSQCSTTRIADIRDGTSNTILIGEKNVRSTNYTDGGDPGDNENLYCGVDNDTHRIAYYNSAEPSKSLTLKRDHPDTANANIFGSAHTAGANFAFCDGSIRMINYTIDALLFSHLINRCDGQVVQLP